MVSLILLLHDMTPGVCIVPPKFWKLFLLQSSLTPLGAKITLVGVDMMTSKRLITAGVVRPWRPTRLGQASREARTVRPSLCPGGVEHLAREAKGNARIKHKAGNWFILTDCSNAFSTLSRTVVLAEVGHRQRVPALAPFGIIPGSATTRDSLMMMHYYSGWTRVRTGRSPAPERQRKGAGLYMGPAVCCLSLRPG